MRQFYFVLFLLLPAVSFCQKLIKGEVVDAEKGSAIAGASVFLNNTSVGTTANAQGKFGLTIPQGKYELIVSSIGYETVNQVVSAADVADFITIRLNPKAQELENVVVEPFEKDGWEKWGRFFTDNFIGTTANARDCKIKNTKAIRFRNNKKTGELTAIAFEPLTIENKALGYQVKYQLENFSYNFNTHYLLYQGYPFFEPMKGSAARQRRWEQERKEAYEGSTMHFMRSVFRNTVDEEGFNVFRLYKKQNTEKLRIRKLVINFNKHTDSTDYYNSVLRQPNEFDIVAKQKLSGDSIAFAYDSTTAGMYFDNYLLIVYRNRMAPVEYRKFYPDNGSAMASQITLLNGRPLEVQYNGSYFNPADLLNLGYWSWSEKISTMLPFDYKLDE